MIWIEMEASTAMTKEQLIRKLTSRKFWVAVVAFITALLTAFNVPEGSSTQVASVIMAFGSLISYLFAEGMTDAAHLDKKENEDE